MGNAVSRLSIRHAPFLPIRGLRTHAKVRGLSSITVADLKKAAAEEACHEQIGNAWVCALQRHVTAVNGRVLGSDNARASYRSMIWGTCLMLGGPSL